MDDKSDNQNTIGKEDDGKIDTNDKSTYTDQMIMDEIYEAILDNRIPPGSRLSQDDLGRVFGVSRTRIRPILLQLVQRKVAVFQKNKGIFVTKLSIDEVISVNNARKIIEEGIVRHVVRHIKPEEIEEIKTIIDNEHESRTKKDLTHAHQLSGSFHIAIAKCTGNEYVIDSLEHLLALDRLSSYLYKESEFEFSVSDHNRILENIASGNEDLAVDAILGHIDHIVESLRSLYGKEKKYSHIEKAFSHLSGKGE